MSATLVADLRAAAGRWPERTAVVDRGRRLAFAGLHEEAAALAAVLVDRGVRRGDRVALVAHNGVDAAVAVHAALLAGAGLVPLDVTAPVARLVHLLDHCGAAVALADDACAERVRAAADLASGAPPVVLLGERADPVDLPEVLPVDLATVVYTSGSTGTPKGVVFLHRNAAAALDAVVASLGLTADDRVLSVLPLSHTYGLYQLLLAVRVGATVVLVPGRTPPGVLVQLLEQERVTVLPGVPTTWQVLVSLRGLAERDLPLRLLTSAGAALPPPLVAEVRRTFPGAGLVVMYGQTECKRACALPADELDRHPGSVGRAVPGTEVWVADAEGREVAPGVVGELLVRGEHVMQGYWDDPVATAAALLPGRLPGDRVLRTGDLFVRDAEGWLTFVSRRDDLIVSRGEKVAPLEVERVLSLAPGVAEAVVVGEPDPRQGAVVVAHVVARDGCELDPAALRAHCARHLEDVRVPRRVVVHAALPRLGSGKVDRLALRTPAGDGPTLRR